ncbi:pancreatic triacylglycerol lipase-like isoform X2 [Venturia canescens]|nr:pancreatic triacylglycerol lipase-like isoform X2 [Venturia canescens]
MAENLLVPFPVLKLTTKLLGKPALGNVTVTFNSYTKRNPKIPDVFDLDKNNRRSQLGYSFFDAMRSTIFVTHGWMENGKSEMCTRLCDEYLANGDVNVVVVDWHGDTFSTYESAAKEVELIGEKIALFMQYLVRNTHLDLSRVTFVGYDMGAHVMGVASNKMVPRVNTIVGLDPPFHEFEGLEEAKKLNRGSANYVQIIHTNGGFYGSKKAVGHADFYPNSGTTQPGCYDDNICSHKRAWEYFAESINSQTGFYGEKCLTHEHLTSLVTNPNEAIACDLGVFGKMGGHDPAHDIQGIFHLQTRAEAPFAIGKP